MQVAKLIVEIHDDEGDGAPVAILGVLEVLRAVQGGLIHGSTQGTALVSKVGERGDYHIMFRLQRWNKRVSSTARERAQSSSELQQ